MRRGGMVRTVAMVAIAVAPLTIASRDAAAQQSPAEMAAAREHYDRGAAAYDNGEYAIAANQLAKADAIVANDVALELALKASIKANDPVLAMELAARADGRKSATLTLARDDARAKMKDRVGRVTFTCAPNVTCKAELDDTVFPINDGRWVLAGKHIATIRGGPGAVQKYEVRVDPGASVTVAQKAVADASAPAPVATPATLTDDNARTRDNEKSDGVSPAWFWVGTGLTVVLGGATVISALDTKSKHDQFRTQPSADLSNAGDNAQIRTNALFIGTIAAAAITGVLGIFFVRWSSGSSNASYERASLVEKTASAALRGVAW